MKKIILLTLFALCCVSSFGIEPDLVDVNLNFKSKQDNPVEMKSGGGGASDVRKGYERYVITIKYNYNYSSTGVSHDEILLSCCIKSTKDKSCDFAFDTIECYRYIDRETGKAYKHKSIAF